MTDHEDNSGLPSAFSALVNLRSTIRFCIETLGKIEQNTREARNLTQIHSNQTFRNHLSRLGDSPEVEDDELSYSLSSTSKALDAGLTTNGHSGDTVVCTVAWGESYRKKVQPCLDSQRAYCASRGYDYAQMTLQPGRVHRHPSWYKVPLVFKLMRQGYAKVSYIDADALITNPGKALDPFFQVLESNQKSIHLAEDDDGINMGVFFMKNRPDALRLLDLIWLYDLGFHRLNWEQAALKDLLNNYGQVRRMVTLANSASAFNSFPGERERLCRTKQENNWSRGDFICHFSGIASPDLEVLIDRYVANNAASTSK